MNLVRCVRLGTVYNKVRSRSPHLAVGLIAGFHVKMGLREMTTILTDNPEILEAPGSLPAKRQSRLTSCPFNLL